jgi:hypothetical protein
VSPGSNPMQILFRGDDRGGLDPYSLTLLNGKFLLNAYSTTSAINVVTPVVVGEWVHIVGTLDVERSRISIYKNGVLAAENETIIRPFTDLDPRQFPGIGIGNVQHPGPHNQPFMGVLDELQLYNRALTPEEVEALANRR